MNETDVLKLVQLEASRLGIRLFRNNSGAFKDASDRWVRYGLGNVSKKLNTSLKSADLIGVTPIRVTQEMVGQTIGVFTSIEVKATGKLPNVQKLGDRETAQLNWKNLILRFGGYAAILDDPKKLKEVFFRGR